MSALPGIDPDVQDDARPFWDATREHRLVVPRCPSCDTVIWYPRGFCPACSSFEIEWIELPGTGAVYSLAVARRGRGAYREHAPYVVAYVELDLVDGTPGPRVMTNVVDADAESVHIGQRVTATWDDTESGHALLRFRPA